MIFGAEMKYHDNPRYPRFTRNHATLHLEELFHLTAIPEVREMFQLKIVLALLTQKIQIKVALMISLG